MGALPPDPHWPLVAGGLCPQTPASALPLKKFLVTRLLASWLIYLTYVQARTVSIQ